MPVGKRYNFVSFMMLYIKSPCTLLFVTLFLPKELIYFNRLKITIQISVENTVLRDFGLIFMITQLFGPECGSPLFTRAEACPGIVFIKAGSLDSPQLIKPTHQTWIEMAVPWAYLDKDLPGFEGNGPSPGEKIE